MPYSRQRPRIAPTGKVGVRLTTAQRDLFLQAAETPRDLGHALHRAPVRNGKLTIRASREALDALIAVAAAARASDRRGERALAALVRYLESLEDRFADPDASDEEEAAAGSG